MSNIAGMALKNGLILQGKNKKIITTLDSNGKITTKVKTLKIKQINENKCVYKIPFIRGFSKILVRNFNFRFIFLLTVISDIIIYCLHINNKIIFDKDTFKIIILILIYAIIFKSKIKDILQYHGAEHKIVNAYESGLRLTVKNVKECSRLSERCGSMIIIYLAIFMIFFTNLIGYISISFLISLSLIYEITNYKNPVTKFISKISLILQKIGTKEPTDEQIIIAISCMKKLIKEELKLKTDLIME